MVLKSECMFNIKRNEISSQKDSYFQHELVSTKKNTINNSIILHIEKGAVMPNITGTMEFYQRLFL